MNTVESKNPVSKARTGAVVPMASITKRVQEILEEEFTPHPFQDGVTRNNARPLLANYLAMSEAFPYLQAGAQRTWILDAIQKNEGVGMDKEITAAVGNFLAADETGVKFVLDRFGVAGLPKILDSDQFFHSHLLKKDLLALFGEAVQPDYSSVTAKYLVRLLDDLADLDPVRRCATMVAFERHAGTMIEALWESLSELFPVRKDALLYFKVHVGGDDPAEPYHVAMTARMIERLVPANRAEDFVRAFRDAYGRNYSWCRAICQRD